MILWYLYPRNISASITEKFIFQMAIDKLQFKQQKLVSKFEAFAVINYLDNFYV